MNSLIRYGGGATVARAEIRCMAKRFCRCWIRRDHYGVFSKFGWQIDHIKPKSAGGDDSIDNLQALHWRNNKSKGTNYLEIETCITSKGFDNIYRIRRWRLSIQK